MVTAPPDRRSRKYGFDSLDTLTVFFSRWIPAAEIRELVAEAETRFHPRKDSSEQETNLQKIQKAEFAIVRRLVHSNPVLG